MAGARLSSRTRAAAVSSAVALALALAGCSAGQTAEVRQRTNTELCLDALALPVTNATQLLLDPSRLPEVRNKAFEVLDMTAPDPDVTEGAHAVALKSVAVIDSTESLLSNSEDPLSLLASGLDGMAQLAGPLQELATAELALTQTCLDIVGPSGVPTPRATSQPV